MYTYELRAVDASNPNEVESVPHFRFNELKTLTGWGVYFKSAGGVLTRIRDFQSWADAAEHIEKLEARRAAGQVVARLKQEMLSSTYYGGNSGVDKQVSI